MRAPLAALLLAAACTSRPEDPVAPAPARAQGPAARGQKGPVLERVRPPAAPCIPGTVASSTDLLARAESEIASGRAPRGLACAEEALEREPRSLPALRARASALAALDRIDESRSTLSRALAADPDDASTLLAAADLLVNRLGDRDALEAGRDHALRGAARVRAAPRPDRPRLARLLLLAGIADNQLGRSRDALLHLDQGLRASPDDLDLHYERGVALFELCRFASARRAFELVLRRDPEDAWALHHLGLIAERSGDETRAGSLLARAARLAPRELHEPVEMDRASFEAAVRSAVAELPDGERTALAAVPVQVEEIPALADLTAVDPPLSPAILGMFRGPPEGEPCPPDAGAPCRSIVLYRRNLLRFAQDRPQVGEQIRVTLRHELGHLHGESDEALRARGLE